MGGRREAKEGEGRGREGKERRGNGMSMGVKERLIEVRIDSGT